MKKENKTYNCPICSGTGSFELPKKVKNEDFEIKKWLVKLLKKKGYGTRQIQRALGYKSPQSINHILSK